MLGRPFFSHFLDSHFPTIGYVCGGVAIGSTTDWKLIVDKKIGEIMDVCFNENSSQILAAEILGDIYVLDLE